MNIHKIKSDTEIVEFVKQVQEKHNSVKSTFRRKNNRKQTKGRRYQTVTVQIGNSSPPKFETRVIKHLR